MPINTRRSTQGFLSSNDDLAASTFAAQIVDNLSSGKFSSKNEDREKFRKLLQEILHTDDDGDEITEAVEKNVDVNHRLIYVVVRAGLESLLNEDPFIDRDELKKQAVESLSVVELTVRRSPEVLFSVLQRPETDLQITGPLYLWLIPKLFIVLVRIEDDDVRQKILQVIQTAIVSESKAWLHQYKFSLTLTYIQGCIKGSLMQMQYGYALFN